MDLPAKTEIAKKRRELIEQFERLRERHERDLAVLDAMFEAHSRFGSVGNADVAASEPMPAQEQRTGPDKIQRKVIADRLTFMNLVELAVETQRNHFTVSDVMASLRQRQPSSCVGRDPATASAYLIRLANAGRLKIVTPGIGRRPTVYQKILADIPAPEANSDSGTEGNHDQEAKSAA